MNRLRGVLGMCTYTQRSTSYKRVHGTDITFFIAADSTYFVCVYGPALMCTDIR